MVSAEPEELPMCTFLAGGNCEKVQLRVAFSARGLIYLCCNYQCAYVGFQGLSWHPHTLQSLWPLILYLHPNFLRSVSDKKQKIFSIIQWNECREKTVLMLLKFWVWFFFFFLLGMCYVNRKREIKLKRECLPSVFCICGRCVRCDSQQ